MKSKIFLIVGILLICIAAVSAAEVCIVAQLDEDNVDGDCIDVDAGTDGYSTLQASNIDFTWSDPGTYGRALCKINGVGDETAGTACAWGSEYWGFYLIRDGTWAYLPVGFDAAGGCWNGDLNSFGGHYCAQDGDVIGFRYGEFGTLPDMLFINDIKIKVDGKKSSADQDGGTIKDAEPESKIEIILELENLYPDDLDVNIEDISVEVIIDKIDDGDEIDAESDETDIDAGKDEEITLEIDIPLEVEEDDFDFTIKITADDDARIDYEKTIEYTLEVDKERHKLKVLKARLLPDTLLCESSTALDYSIYNLGTSKEDVKLKITNSNLGINIEDEFELDDDPFDDDSKFEKKYAIAVNGAEPGTYQLLVKTEYEDEEEIETINLVVEECKTGKKEVKEDVKVDAPKPDIIIPAQTTPITIEQKSFRESNGYLILLGALIIVGIIAIFVLILKK